MEDSYLLKLSLIIGIFGIFSLFVILQFTEPEVKGIQDIALVNENEKLVIYGEITEITETDKTISLEISEYKKISVKALYFKKDSSFNITENSLFLNISNKDFVKITGRKYKDIILIDRVDKLRK